MITVTVTGNLTDDPHTFTTRDNTTGCELRVAVNLPSRTGTGDGPTRYLKVVTFGVLAIHAAESVRKGDRVTICGHDLTSEAWLGNGDGQPKSKVAIRATEIAVSLRYDNATTGRATRAAQHATGPQAQADAAVLNGVTTAT
jgi:single-stranded DNA-binding protein